MMNAAYSNKGASNYLRSILSSRLWLYLFVAALLVLLYMLLKHPGAEEKLGFNDKLVHGLAFAAVSLLGAIAFPQRLLLLALFIGSYAAGTEILQAMTGWRQGDILDFAADMVGCGIALTLFALYRRYTHYGLPTA